MFLDLNDATTIAEKLGSKKYSFLLNDFFTDLDSAFTKTKGHVFQYVGDEVVVIWNPKTGLKNNNCLKAYFLAEQILGSKKEYYLNKYKASVTKRIFLNSLKLYCSTSIAFLISSNLSDSVVNLSDS